eukprot:gene34036-41196_t
MDRIAKGVVITGASGGLGRAIAVAYVTNFSNEDIHFIISGRRTDELVATQEQVMSKRANGQTITCKHVVADLSDASDMASVAKQLFDFGDIQLKSVVFINNAGSLGPVRPIGDALHSADEYVKAFNLNVTSSCFLTSEFVRHLSSASYQPQSQDVTIVNISSLAAVQAMDCKGVYCAGKAARDMYHKVLAEQVKTSSNRTYHILNYAPGPLDTPMQTILRAGADTPAHIQSVFMDMFQKQQLIDPIVTANKMVFILQRGLFENGGHVDFYDVEM